MVQSRMTAQSWGLLILLSIVWGGSFFFNEILLRELEPLPLVLGRTAIAALMLLAIVYSRGYRMPTAPRLWVAFFVMGFINNLLPFSLIVWGQQYISGGLAAILNATTPLFTIILAHLFTKDERLTLPKLIGGVVGFGGVVVLLGLDESASFGLIGLGQVAVLGAACSYAFAGIYGRRFRDLPAIIPATGMLTATALMSIPAVVLVQPVGKWQFSAETIWALFGLAVVSTALAYLIYFRILALAGASNVLLVTFLVPLSAIVLGILFLNEQLAGNQFLGMLLIFLGLLTVDGRLIGKLGKMLGKG